MPKQKTTTISLSDIELAPSMQARTAIKEATVQDYTEAMRDGAIFPPIVVMQNCGMEAPYCMIDGWHRHAAALALNHSTIEAIVLTGDRADAMWAAAGMNISHGLRRSNADKARAVSLALKVRPDATYQEIAAHCGVSVSMISAYFNAMQEVDAVQEEQAAPPRETEAVETEEAPAESAITTRMRHAKVAIQSAVSTLEDAHEIVSNLTASDEGAYVNAQSVLSDLMNAIGALKHAAPYRVCPLCNGEGCETCRMLGWVSKKQWQLIPPEMRGE